MSEALNFSWLVDYHKGPDAWEVYEVDDLGVFVWVPAAHEDAVRSFLESQSVRHHVDPDTLRGSADAEVLFVFGKDAIVSDLQKLVDSPRP